MNDIQIFNNCEFGKIRTVLLDDKPYFVGKDVAEVLGYQNGSRDINRHVDEEDIDGVPIQDSIGRMQNTLIINESGLYSLILSSKMPKAKEFKRWVTSEVLPSIRKHGVYAIDDVLKNPDLLISALQELKKERQIKKELETAVSVQSQQIQELKPKASYYDIVLQNKTLLSITQIAKDYGLSGRKLNQILKEQKIQFKQSGVWLLYQKYAKYGYTQTKTEILNGGRLDKVHTYWTQKGRLFIYELLKRLDILPSVEKG